MNTYVLRKYILRANERGLFRWLPDRPFLHLMYWARLEKRLNLKNPKTFNEKLQWLKLHDRRSEYTQMVDKYDAKRYIASVVGAEYVIPTLGVWENFDDINFGNLPKQFVLKCTHDSGGLVVCNDRSKLDFAVAKRKIQRSLKVNYYFHGREWPYKNVKHRIIAEEYIEDTANDALTDYKFFCFDGVPRIMYISKDHGKDPRRDFFDTDFNHLSFEFGDPNAEIPPQKPVYFEKMKQFAGLLSQGVPFLRVDFYEVNGKLYVGELTFYHASGFDDIDPEEWDEKMGSWLNLPTV